MRTLDGPSGDAMPARIQVIPVAGLPARPPSFGEQREAGGRLYQAYPADGDETLRVPVGEHDVIATHGFEREVARTRVMVTANTTAEVELTLVPSVESTGIQCADFHIHSHFSADSSDLVELKVRSAAGDGLELPVSTEHESIVDFQPVVEALGLGRWTRGFAGSELTTFQWGHFGVFPLVPRPELPNFGVVRWYGRTPGEVFAEVLARPSEPMVIINHPRSGGALGGYFNAIGFDRVTGEVGTGDFVFPGVVVRDLPAPTTIRAGGAGAILLTGDQALAREILTGSPPLIGILGE
ncbi:MAG: hypothetical protein HUU21_26720 [Polyangiaceae bacterium]|nr:hypothetical protein [Polyangiaceae bacterium]